MKNIAEIKEKLKKLIAKEASAREIGSIEEAEAFAGKIAQLLLEYELEIKDLRDAPEETSVRHEEFDTEALTNRHESNWIALLYGACCRSCFCISLLNGNASTTRIIIFGTAQNKEFLHYMVAQLIVKLRELARISWKNYSGEDKRNTFIRSFYKGACAGLAGRLALDRMTQGQKSSDAKGLMVQKDRAIQIYMEERGWGVGKSKTRKSASDAGYEQGVEAGGKVPINKGMGSRKDTKLLN